MIVLKHLWALPLSLFGLLLWPFYGTRWVKWQNGALVVGCRRILGFKTTAGQTMGGIVFLKYAKKEHVPHSRIWRHEYKHAKQAFKGGIFFGLAYILDSAWRMFRPSKFMDLRQAYLDNRFEVDARKAE